MNNNILLLIFVEGDSERNYLTHLLTKTPLIRGKFRFETRKWINQNEIIKEMRKFTKIKKVTAESFYIFLDKDKIEDDIFEKILSQAKKEKIKVLFSNPCFEVFLLLHYKAFNGIKDNKRYYKELSKEMALSKVGGYEKNKAKIEDYDIYESLIPFKLSEFIKNFRKLEKYHKQENNSVVEHLLNPYTNIIHFFNDIGLIKEYEKNKLI